MLGEVGGCAVGRARAPRRQLVEHLGGGPHRVPRVHEALAPLLFGRAVRGPAPRRPGPPGAGDPLQPPELHRRAVPEHRRGGDAARYEALAVQQAQGQRQIPGEDRLVGRGQSMGAPDGDAARGRVQQERFGGVQFVADERGEQVRVRRVLHGPGELERGARLGVQQGAGRRVGGVGRRQEDLDALLPLVVEQPVAYPLRQRRIAAGGLAEAGRCGAAAAGGFGEREVRAPGARRFRPAGVRGGHHPSSPPVSAPALL